MDLDSPQQSLTNFTMNETDVTTTTTMEPAAFSCPEQKLINDLWVRVVLCVCYVVIFSIGFTGNLLVILVSKDQICY